MIKTIIIWVLVVPTVLLIAGALLSTIEVDSRGHGRHITPAQLERWEEAANSCYSQYGDC